MLKMKLNRFIIWALLLTIISGFTAYFITNLYFKHNAYNLDPVYYLYYNAELSEKIKYTGREQVLLDEWRHNSRHPLRTIPLIAVAPVLLTKTFGHMSITLVALAVYLALLGWTIYRRSGNASYAFVMMALFAVLPGLFGPAVGLAAYWLDITAALFSGGALLSLLNSDETRNRQWLMASAILFSCAVLSRYIALFFAGVMFFPVLAYYLVKRYSVEKDIIRSVLYPLLLTMGIIFLLAGYFIIFQYKANMSFYTHYGYGLHNGYVRAAVEVCGAVSRFFFWYKSFAWIVLFLLTGLFCFNLWILKITRKWADALVLLWMGISVMLAHIYIQSVYSYHTSLYGVPLLFLFLVNTSAWPSKLKEQEWVRPAILVLTALIVISGTLTINGYIKFAGHPGIDASGRKKRDMRLAKELALAGDKIVWSSFFDESSWSVSMETFYRYHTLPLPAGQVYFNVHEMAWKSDYPDFSMAEVAEKVYNSSLRWVNVAVVLANPNEVQSNIFLDNPYSRYVAHYMSSRMASDNRWRKIFTVKSYHYGLLAGYLNTKPNPDNYEQVLMKNPAIHP